MAVSDTSEDRIERLNTVEPDWEAKEERALVRKLDLRVLFPCGTHPLDSYPLIFMLTA